MILKKTLILEINSLNKRLVVEVIYKFFWSCKALSNKNTAKITQGTELAGSMAFVGSQHWLNKCLETEGMPILGEAWGRYYVTSRRCSRHSPLVSIVLTKKTRRNSYTMSALFSLPVLNSLGSRKWSRVIHCTKWVNGRPENLEED